MRPVWRLESSRASFMRCASPPESVVAALAEMDVAEADIDQRLQLLADLRDVGEHGQRVFDGEVENVGDGVAVELYGERFLVVAAAVADFALHVDVGHEVHFDAALAVALAGLAAAAGDVEAEAAGLVAALARLGQHGEEIADGGEDAGVGRGIGARRAADRRLVDADDLVDLVGAVDASRARRVLRASRRVRGRASGRECR